MAAGKNYTENADNYIFYGTIRRKKTALPPAKIRLKPAYCF